MTPRSQRCFNASTPCHVEWRPSRLCAASAWLLGMAAAVALWLSDLPAWLQTIGSLTCLARAGWLARHLRRRPHRQLLWPARGAVLLDGEPIDAPRLHWRGPWVFVHWREGSRRQALAWWPDTLDATRRRELRLVAGGSDISRLPPSVAT